MKQNESFLNTLNTIFYIIYGSFTIKEKINREPNDIDIYIKECDIEYFDFLSKKYDFEIITGGVEIGPYGETDFVIQEFKFSDGSKIQINLVNNFDSLDFYEYGKEKIKIIKLEQVLLGKLKNILYTKEFGEKQKIHLEDLKKFDIFNFLKL